MYVAYCTVLLRASTSNKGRSNQLCNALEQIEMHPQNLLISQSNGIQHASYIVPLEWETTLESSNCKLCLLSFIFLYKSTSRQHR